MTDPVTLTVNIIGTPIPQGSKGARIQGKRAVLFDTNADKLKPWRKEVTRATKEAMHHSDWITLDAPTELAVTFYQPRPANHYGTGRNADRLKPSAPTWCVAKPDIDKLLRAVLDGLTDAGAIVDDSRIVRVIADHRYANGPAGVRLHLTPITSEDTQ